MRLNTIATTLAGLGLATANELRRSNVVDANSTPSTVATSAYYSATVASPSTDAQNTTVVLRDATTMRRALYLVGYPSAAAGVGHAMQAYNAQAWCTSNSNKGWCPLAMNSTVSGIAGKVVNATGASKITPETCDDVCFVESLSEVSRLCAIEAIFWTAGIFNDTTPWSKVPKPASNDTALGQLAWTVDQLQHNSTSKVHDKEALLLAMSSSATGFQVPRPVIGPTTESMIGTESVRDVLGPLLDGAQDMPGIPTASTNWLTRILQAASQSRILNPANWFRYLCGLGNRKPPVDPMYPYAPDNYAAWSRDGLHGDFVRESQRAPLERLVSSERATMSGGTGPGPFRAETLNPETGVLEQTLLQAVEGNTPSSRLLQPFRAVKGGKGIPKTELRFPGSLSEFDPTLPKAALGEGGLALHMTEEGLAAVDSMGLPLISMMAEPETAELMTLAPVGEMLGISAFHLLFGSGDEFLGNDGKPVQVRWPMAGQSLPKLVQDGKVFNCEDPLKQYTNVGKPTKPNYVEDQPVRQETKTVKLDTPEHTADPHPRPSAESTAGSAEASQMSTAHTKAPATVTVSAKAPATVTISAKAPATVTVSAKAPPTVTVSATATTLSTVTVAATGPLPTATDSDGHPVLDFAPPHKPLYLKHPPTIYYDDELEMFWGLGAANQNMHRCDSLQDLDQYEKYGHLVLPRKCKGVTWGAGWQMDPNQISKKGQKRRASCHHQIYMWLHTYHCPPHDGSY